MCKYIYIYIHIYVALSENMKVAAHPYKKARVAPPHHIKDDGDSTNHFIKGGDTPPPSLQGSILSRRWR